MTSNDRALDYLKRATQELRSTKQKLADTEYRLLEPIAVVGMACRYPGGIADPEGLWQLVESGSDAISGFPLNRGWDVESLYSPDPDRRGTTYCREGGFLHDAGDFDAGFFGISPREAVAMDPQQRLLLETSWEAVENARINPTDLRGTQTAVYAGVMYHDYADNAAEVTDDGGDTEELGLGSAGSVVSGRVSYALGLEGPAVTVDTACSSSLVALHLAVQALRRGECSLALAGGVTVMATPSTFVSFSRQRGLAPDGRCKAFADGADGTGWSEGVGVLLVERLSDAKRNRRRILGIVRGTAVNQDGASNGLTAPNGPAQERVIRAALADAGLSPSDVDAVEAHGTGTPLGDPIEAQALLATYGQEHSADRPLWLGSIKSNIGHTQAAAGVAGVIKMIEAMRHGVVPRSLHTEDPSSRIDWAAGAVELLQQAAAWPQTGRPPRAGVSSFGISGTNAHVIIEAAPDDAEEKPQTPSTPTALRPWVLSGKSSSAMQAQAARLARSVDCQTRDMNAIAYSLAATRTTFNHRAAVIPTPGVDVAEALTALAAGHEHAAVVTGTVNRTAKTAFLFAGQGTQHVGMGTRLYEEFPVFASALDAVCAELDPLLHFPLRQLMFDGPIDELRQTRAAQPAIFAFEIALYRLWESWGARPDFVAGHSVGEIAAAHIAGILDLASATRLIAARAHLMQELTDPGAMLAVALSEEETQQLIGDHHETVSIAAVNGPDATVLAGPPDAINQLAADCAERGHRARKLNVSHAFHSAMMEPMLDRFAEQIADLPFSKPTIEFASALTGTPPSTGQIGSPHYWVQHVRNTVRFGATLEWLTTQGAQRFLEIGPDTVLTGFAKAHAPNAISVASTNPGDQHLTGLFTALAHLHANGLAANWSTIFAPDTTPIDLPTYPFEHTHYWKKRGTTSPPDIGLESADHPFVGVRIESPRDRGVELAGRLSLADAGWLADHVVSERVIVPGSTLVDLAVYAGSSVGAPTVRELTLLSPLIFGESSDIKLRMSLQPSSDTEYLLTISSYAAASSNDWTVNASAYLSDDSFTPTMSAIPDWSIETSRDIGEHYGALRVLGYNYGPSFRALRRVWQIGEQCYGELILPNSGFSEADPFGIHPVLLDAAMHVFGIYGDAAARTDLGVMVPFSFRNCQLHQPGASAGRVAVHPLSKSSFRLELQDRDGQPVFTVDEVALRPLTSEPGGPTGTLLIQDKATLDVRQLDGSPNGSEIFIGEWPEASTWAWDCEPLPSLSDLDAGHLHPITIYIRHQRMPAGQTASEFVTACAADVLGDLQFFLANDFVDCRIVFVTSPGLEPFTALANAAAVGLIRSAQSEHPGRFVIAEVDDDRQSVATARTAVAAGILEFSAAGSDVSVPWLRPAPAGNAVSADLGTVLITGASGGIAAPLAEHLFHAHGVRRFVLASRRAAPAIEARLTALGAEVVSVRCDAARLHALEQALDAISVDSIFHLAGVTRDGLVESLSADDIRITVEPKVEGALNLYRYAAANAVRNLVLFSSVAATVGSPGQGNYSAANAAMSGVAKLASRFGIRAQSIAWGPWKIGGGMGSDLTDLDSSRMHRAGFEPMPADEAFQLLDQAIGQESVDLFAAMLSGSHSSEIFDRLMRPLVRYHDRVSDQQKQLLDETALVGQLRAADNEMRIRRLESHIIRQLGSSLGYGTGDLAPETSFRDAGIDSMLAIELRNKLAADTGLSLSSSLIFDYPNPADLARHLMTKLFPKATLADETPTRGHPHESDFLEPIAVVGMACRYPGGIADPEGLWQLVESGSDAISGFPLNRGWDVESLYSPDPDRRGTTYCREGGFLHDAGDFDAGFFGISPREAVAMDPQQRLLLETSWEAVENARINPTDLRGTQTAVYAGVMYHDYADNAAEVTDDGGDTEELGLGSAGSVVSGRVSYALGLEGPAVTVDTACSSSLVALHLAVQALRRGECSLALAGGVTVMATPSTFVSFSRQRGLAPDGRCKAFADGADGTGWSEGVGVLLVERLSDAKRNRRRILGIVRGTAVNQDGASNGLTAPNGPAQERVIRAALADAGLSPSDVDAVEAHGTGTPLGDPIEAQALLATYGQEHSADRPLWLGSIKSNIGHTQAAAGVAGVIKMIEAMRHGVVPRSLHTEDPSSRIDWAAGAVELLQQAAAWPQTGRPPRAGVSSFGISGTNAHVIIEAAPDDAEEKPQTPSTPTALRPWVLSGKSSSAMQAQAARLARSVDCQTRDMNAIAYSLAATRTTFNHRAAVIPTPGVDVAEALTALAAGHEHAAVVTGTVNRTAKTAFLFAGQGTQHVGMGTRLYEEFPVFASALDAVCAELDPLLHFPLRQLMFDGPIDELRQTRAAQPAIFAFEIALYRLWESWGARPDFVAGHSVGEIAAAHIAGILDLASATRLIAARAHLMQELTDPGAMLAVALSEEETQQLIGDHHETVSIAAVNGPDATVLAGPPDAINQLAADCAERGHRARKLNVSHAFHSAMMEPMLDRFAEQIADLPFSKPTIEFASALTGTPPSTGQIGSPHYWVQHVRNTVRFGATLEWLTTQGAQRFLEIGPDTVLTGFAKAHAPNAISVASTNPGDQHLTGLFTALAHLHANGLAANWSTIFAPDTTPIDLPTYPFEHTHYWKKRGTSLKLHSSMKQRSAADKFWSIVKDGEVAELQQLLALPAEDVHHPQEFLAALRDWYISIVDTGHTDLDSTHQGNDIATEDVAAQLIAIDSRPERREYLAELVTRISGQILGYDNLTAVDRTADFMDLGLSSIMAIDIRNRIITATGLDIPAAIMYDYPTIDAIAEYLEEEMNEVYESKVAK